MEKILGEFFKYAEKASKGIPGLVAGLAIGAIVHVVDTICGYYGSQGCPDLAENLTDDVEEDFDIG